MQPLSTKLDHQIDETDRLRSQIYRLFARCLASAPDARLLEILGGLNGDDSELGTALGEMAMAASQTELHAAQDEYHDLFIGVGRGELLPYGSYYLTGFLNEKPLARLRNDMADLGIERNPDVHEPEDHAGALMEMMAGLIEGEFNAPLSHQEQHRFFEKHLNSWLPHFFGDLEKARKAVLYRPLGRAGRLFMDIENAAFAM